MLCRPRPLRWGSCASPRTEARPPADASPPRCWARLHRARLQTRAWTRRGGGPALALRLPPAGRPTASCGGPVGTVTCRPAEASPGKVGPRRPRAGPRLARLPPRWPRPGRPRVPPSVPPPVPPPAPAPACAAGSGFAGEAGAGVGRRRRIWPPLQTGGSPRPWRTAGSFVSAAPVAPAGGVMVPGADAHCRGHRPARPPAASPPG